MTPLFPLVLTWLAGAALLAADGRRPAVAWSAAAVLGVAFALDVGFLARLLAGGEAFATTTGSWPAGVGIRFLADEAALAFAALVAGVLAGVLVHEASCGVRARLFPALVLLLAAGLHGAFLTGDLFDFYVFFELSIVSSFALAAYGYGRAELRGTFVYVAVNLLGSMLFLIGVAVLYQDRGTLDLVEMARRAPPSAGAAGGTEAASSVAGALLFSALALKLGLFPFHGWVPVLYGHVRPAVAAAMSGALVNLAAYGLLRIGWTALAGARDLGSPVLVLLGSVGAVYGGLLALRRNRPEEVTAYASIGHAGYVVLAVGTGGAAGVAAALLVTIAGALDKTAMFLALDSARGARGTSALAAAAGTGGLPPTVGFASKAMLLFAAFESTLPWIAVPAVLAASFLTLGASARYLRLARRDRPRARAGGAVPLALAAASVAFGLWPEPLARFSDRVGAALERVPGDVASKASEQGGDPP